MRESGTLYKLTAVLGLLDAAASLLEEGFPVWAEDLAHVTDEIEARVKTYDGARLTEAAEGTPIAELQLLG